MKKYLRAKHIATEYLGTYLMTLTKCSAQRKDLAGQNSTILFFSRGQ
jgi:hypothetical protein